ncbi:pilus assembly protein PilM [Melaminivora sp.]|uniref:pilus assembly protein PilM n=1 Tax=Melaminivora sp. TaxID=1933032 RepID=UPI0028ADAD0F|nr:pilus assembly protein PilM [Melaminivora sp.]
MRLLPRRQPAPLLGVDISPSSIKLVELGRDDAGALVLERCAIEQLERGCVTDGSIERFDEVAEVLRRAVKISGTRTRDVALALPPSTVITKRISLPGDMDEQELQVQAESAASQYVPFSLDEVSLDFCVVGPARNAPGDVEVLIAASRRDKVQDREAVAEAAGLRAVIVDIESHAARLAATRLIETLPNRGADAVVALFEVGALATSLQIIRSDDVLYERDQAFGGAQLTQLIVRQYGLTPEEAERRKRSGELPEDYAAAVLQPFVQSLAQELGRALQFFFTSTSYHQVDCILLAGGSATLPGLAAQIEHNTGFACLVANPFERMLVGAAVRPARLAREAPSYLTSCGLALRRFLR